MPYGFERLNERSQRPNALINFIKPLEGPDKALAEEFLSRIAAQCYPVMKAAHISVMSLEEYEPNPEFLGRNFNAGECIQLVLKNKQGQWLGFKYVQMVMMHELAHCKQMNHSRDFWKVRNGFAEDMEGLWKRKYSGEGIWGRGQDLATGSFMSNNAVEPGSVPQHLCGGTYRRRGRKRKRGLRADGTNSEISTYAERQQKRIARKFGKHGEGNELGDDELVRSAYEQGKRHYGKPRVANSKRGRELRAQAALARFGAAKAEQDQQSEASTQEDSDSDIGWSDNEIGGIEEDGDVPNHIKVCGKEDEDDENANQESNELQALGQRPGGKLQHAFDGKSQAAVLLRAPSPDDIDTESETEPTPSEVVPGTTTTSVSEAPNEQSDTTSAEPSPPMDAEVENSKLVSSSRICAICSLENEQDSLLCTACSNVLRPNLVKDTWSCASQQCRESPYLNAGDAGRCGICGSLKPSKPAAPIIGLTSASILRWD